MESLIPRDNPSLQTSHFSFLCDRIRWADFFDSLLRSFVLEYSLFLRAGGVFLFWYSWASPSDTGLGRSRAAGVGNLTRTTYTYTYPYMASCPASQHSFFLGFFFFGIVPSILWTRNFITDKIPWDSHVRSATIYLDTLTWR